jgi:hypothetical protein
MGTIMVCLAAAMLGVDVGWQRLPDGGMEYIIQIEPQTLEALRAGEAIQSDVPAEAGDIRSYRIVVGSKKQLTRDKPAAPRTTARQKTAANEVVPPAAPQRLAPDPAIKPLRGQPATFVEPSSASPAAKPAAPAAAAASPEQPARPWLPLTFALFGLFASLGGNFYLGWIAWDMRRRCQTLMASPSH